MSVTGFVNLTAPGVFTVPPGGVGYGAVLHGNHSLVTADNPAQVNGDGVRIPDRAGHQRSPLPTARPGRPAARRTTPSMVYIGGQQATVSYSGLSPQLAGLYQIDFTRAPRRYRRG